MSKPTKAIAFLEKSNIGLTEIQRQRILMALEVAFEEGVQSKPSFTFNPADYTNFIKAMENRLAKDGIIRTGEAWELAKGISGYGTVCNMMRHIMSELESKGTAVKIRNGVWILNHNDKQ